MNHGHVTKALPTGGWRARPSSPLPALPTCESGLPRSLSVQIRKPREWICGWQRAFLWQTYVHLCPCCRSFLGRRAIWTRSVGAPHCFLSDSGMCHSWGPQQRPRIFPVFLYSEEVRSSSFLFKLQSKRPNFCPCAFGKQRNPAGLTTQHCIVFFIYSLTL